MGHNGSDVRALLGLNGFVVVADLSRRRPASGGWRWRRPRTGPGARPAESGPSAMAAAG
jgi:hypothetical protein